MTTTLRLDKAFPLGFAVFFEVADGTEARDWKLGEIAADSFAEGSVLPRSVAKKLILERLLGDVDGPRGSGLGGFVNKRFEHFAVTAVRRVGREASDLSAAVGGILEIVASLVE